MAGHQPEIRKAGDLAADRGVIAADPPGEIDHPDRAQSFDQNQKRKQGAFQREAGGLQHGFVAFRPVHHADDLDQGTMQRRKSGMNMCIMHVFG